MSAVLWGRTGRAAQTPPAVRSKSVSTGHFHFPSNDQDYSAPTALINLAQDCRVLA